MDEKTKTIKILVLGDNCTGKTALVDRYFKGTFYDSHFATIGIEYKTINVTSDTDRYSLQIWDASGNRNFYKFVRSYYDIVDGVIVTYDVCNYNSYLHTKDWMNGLRPSMPKLLVGCKSDSTMPKAVSSGDALLFSRDEGMEFIETSSKEDRFVIEAFQLIIFQVIKQKYNRVETPFGRDSFYTIHSGENSVISRPSQDIQRSCRNYFCFWRKLNDK